MKKFLSIALCMLAFCACATFVSCGDDDNESNDNAAVVTEDKQSTTENPVYWTTDASYTATKVNVLEFNSDQSTITRREYRNGSLNYSGTYSYRISGSTIYLTGEFDGKTQTVSATIKSWTSDKLIIDMGGETETYTKVTSIPYSDK